MNILSWKNLAESLGDGELLSWEFQLKASITEMTLHEYIKLVGD